MGVWVGEAGRGVGNGPPSRLSPSLFTTTTLPPLSFTHSPSLSILSTIFPYNFLPYKKVLDNHLGEFPINIPHSTIASTPPTQLFISCIPTLVPGSNCLRDLSFAFIFVPRPRDLTVAHLAPATQIYILLIQPTGPTDILNWTGQFCRAQSSNFVTSISEFALFSKSLFARVRLLVSWVDRSRSVWGRAHGVPTHHRPPNRARTIASTVLISSLPFILLRLTSLLVFYIFLFPFPLLLPCRRQAYHPTNPTVLGPLL